MKKIITLTALFTPLAAMAVVAGDIVGTLGNILATIVPVLITLALIVFIVGVIQYITAGAEEEKREKARNTIIYGIIGLFAIVAVWGLVAMIQQTFGVTETTVEPPQYRF